MTHFMHVMHELKYHINQLFINSITLYPFKSIPTQTPSTHRMRLLDQSRFHHVLLAHGLDNQRSETFGLARRVGGLDHEVARVLLEHLRYQEGVTLADRRQLQKSLEFRLLNGRE